KIYIAITTILKELNKLKEKEISLRELSRAKDYLLGQVAMGLERPQGMMFYLAENYLTLGKIEEFKDIKNQVAAITPEKIKKLANEIFNFKNICISCIGDIENGIEDKIKKILGNI
ncbi:MAG: insulinase family protein, partial [Candidatus Omnitrophica bacterium]|nr:insulinase family protein [Candidatus Omnitrophota bacterium]